MSDIRNITKEAIEWAEAQVIKSNPNLASKEYRRRLSAFDKQFLFMDLLSLGEFYENNFLRKKR